MLVEVYRLFRLSELVDVRLIRRDPVFPHRGGRHRRTRRGTNYYWEFTALRALPDVANQQPKALRPKQAAGLF
jgi:hypothetical protein